MTSQAIERIVNQIDEIMENNLSEEFYEELSIWGAGRNTVDDYGTIIVEYLDDWSKSYDVESENMDDIVECANSIIDDAEEFFEMEMQDRRRFRDDNSNGIPDVEEDVNENGVPDNEEEFPLMF